MTSAEVLFMIESEQGAGSVCMNDDLDSLAIDSLEYINLILHLENESQIHMPKDKLTDMRKVCDLVSFFAEAA